MTFRCFPSPQAPGWGEGGGGGLHAIFILQPNRQMWYVCVGLLIIYVFIIIIIMHYM